MKQRKISKTNVVNFSTYLGMVIFFLVMTALSKAGVLNRSMTGLLVPICCYMSMAVSLNLTVGILGELSLGHAGFMSVGAFAGVIASQSLLDVVPSAGLRLTIAMIVGALFATIAGFIVGAPVLRLQGDYLAIVTLAFGEIIKELVNCLLVGYDENGLHIAMNLTGSKSIADLNLSPDGFAIIKGAQGATGTATISSFTAGFILVMITLFVVLNLKDSRAGRAIMALRDNTIAAESVGLNITKYKLMAFVTSAALAGAAGAVNSVTFQRATFMTSPLLPVSVAGIMVGLFFITRPYTLVEIVGLIICVFLMIQGMTSIQTAVNRKRWGDTLWWVPLIIGIACVLLGVYALFAPGASTALMMRIAGIMLAFSGVVNMIAAFALTKQ